MTPFWLGSAIWSCWWGATLPDVAIGAPPRERDPLGRAARVYVAAMVARGAWDRGMHVF